MKNKLMAKHCEKREENREREREKGEGEREEKTQAPVKIHHIQYIVYILYINNIIFNPMSREIVIYD